jgi:putative nucleotidyltransferase with HDIG domain
MSREPLISDAERSARLERIHKAIAEHPPMPAFHRDLLPHIQDPNVGYEQLSKIIRNDPGVTMNILRMANTAYYSGTTRIDSLQHALVRMGARRLFQIIIAYGVASRLARPLEGYGLAPRMLLKHSVGVAITSENVARLLKQSIHEMLFTAGLLHDMGKIVLDPFVVETRAQFDALLRDTTMTFDEIEQELLGITHPEAGARLMDLWNFPESVIQVVRHHHRPAKAEGMENEALMVHLADTLIYSEGVGDGIDGLRYEVASDETQRLGLRARDIEQVASRTLGQLNELEDMIV